jgi:hypothetical protein
VGNSDSVGGITGIANHAVIASITGPGVTSISNTNVSAITACRDGDGEIIF